MASTHHSPVMVSQPSSPPVHSFSSPEHAFPILSPTIANDRASSISAPTTMPEYREVAQPIQQPEEQTVQQETSGSSESSANGEADTSEEHPTSEHVNDGDDHSSNSETNSESSTSTETPGTVSTPRSSAHDSGHQVPASAATQLEGQSTDQSPPHANAASEAEVPVSSPDSDRPNEILSIPPPPVDINVPVTENIPSWVLYDEDTSSPNEEELRAIGANKHELDATDVNAIEKDVFSDVNDPEYRPYKKIRLSWIVKGVRGTKEKPNRARIMTSPSVCIDGNYWNIKFFPRGNKSRNCLAAYLRCSPAELPPSNENLVGSFKCWEGAPTTDFAKADPIVDLELKLFEPKDEKEILVEPSRKGSNEQGDAPTPQGEEEQPQASTGEPMPEVHRRRGSRDDDESVSGDEDDQPDSSANHNVVEDYRVSAQLGLVIYNPAEPRTCHTASASHQFNPHLDDWGWDTAVGRWEDIHRRKHGQRQALLREDTLAVDAYIMIYDDPTKALFWHPAIGESQWDSKGLTGVFPVGTRLLYHSPATAGLIAWSLLAPFRRAVQSIDAGVWRRDSAARPRPLTASLQLMLFQMRHMKKDELYIRLDEVIKEITRHGESFDTVNAFWEALRRSIEIETSADGQTLELLESTFGTREQLRRLPLLPVQNVANFQDSATKAFEKVNFKGELPDFLPLSLQRQSFDAGKRQWQLHNDRVRISEELDLSPFCSDGDGRYTLYGFIVHDGDRTSGKFLSVLRPHGPGGKWLAFSDGNGNKVFSYTKKRVQEYEGLEGYELKKAIDNRQTIHTALYIRSSRVSSFLYKELEPYKLPAWLKQHLEETYYHDQALFEGPEHFDDEMPVPIEIFWDKSVGGQEGKLDLYTLKSNDKARLPEHRQTLTAHQDAIIADIKAKVASILGVDQRAFKLWAMNHPRIGGMSKGYMQVLSPTSKVRTCLNTSVHLSLWLTTLPGRYEISEEALAQNFLKLGGEHIEAPPPPEPSVIEDSLAPAEENAANARSGDSGDIEAEASVDSTGAGEIAASDAEQTSVQEAVEYTAGSAAIAESATEMTNDDDTVAQPIAATVPEADTLAAPDAEQASVREAVQRSIHGDTTTSESAVTQIFEIEASDTVGQRPSGVNLEAAPPTIVARPGLVSGPSNDSPTQAASPTAPLTVEDVASPRLHSSSPPELQANLLVTPSESTSVIYSTENTDDIISLEAGANHEVAAVVHGHLLEVSSHHEAPSTLTESYTNEPPLAHSEPVLPVEFSTAIGTDRILIVQPNQDDISAEDAALISSMIAADLAAAENNRQPPAGDEGELEGESEREEDVIESRPMTPRQRIPNVYGFLHVFDAANQKFTAHGTFDVSPDTTISATVRKQMGYEEGKSFHLWKREGTYRTVRVSLESTFRDASLTDCCEVIVGDYLGEEEIEAVKAEAKYVNPGHLMRYLAMAQRGHPTASLTTQDDIEMSEFGGDYYKGPLVRGQRHGKGCSVITQAGDTYVGPLIAGQKSGGKGKMTYQNGDVYDGDWLDDQKHGQGEFLEKRTGNRYVGGYENDKRWGKGVTYWEQADQQAALCQVCYFEEIDALFYRCGHVVACYACAKLCVSESNACPVCRKPIEAVVKMYRS